MPRHSCAVWTTGPNRRRYRSAGTIWLLADRASAHTAARTQMLAAALDIRFLWLPKQAPELNAMDQLWRELKRLIAANRQAASADALASNAAGWLLGLTPRQTRRKAGMASKHFWLKEPDTRLLATYLGTETVELCGGWEVL